MVDGNRIGDQLQDDGLTSPGRSDDQATLAFSYGGYDVEDPGLIDICFRFDL